LRTQLGLFVLTFFEGIRHLHPRICALQLEVHLIEGGTPSIQQFLCIVHHHNGNITESGSIQRITAIHHMPVHLACTSTSSKLYSPAKRSDKDFATVHSTDSKGEEPDISEVVAKRLKTQGWAVATKESQGSSSDSEEETNRKADEVHHEIDGANEEEDPSLDDIEEEEDLTYIHCGGTPCVWQQLGPEIVALGVSHDWLNPESDNHAFNVTHFDGKNQQELTILE
jgi:hypothetical protein